MQLRRRANDCHEGLRPAATPKQHDQALPTASPKEPLHNAVVTCKSAHLDANADPVLLMRKFAERRSFAVWSCPLYFDSRVALGEVAATAVTRALVVLSAEEVRADCDALGIS